MQSGLDRRTLLAGFASLPLLTQYSAAGGDVRIASLDYALAETLLAIGHPPVAVTSAADWDKWVIEPPLPPGVADLGSHIDVNLERLALIDPDLILTTDFVKRQEPALGRIAETWRLTIYEPGSVPLERAQDVMLALGKRLGRLEAARTVLADADRAFADYRRRIKALDPLPVLLVNFMDARHVRVYGGQGLYQNVLDRIGLVNAWRGGSNYWGFATVGIEDLATGKDVRLFAFEPIPADTQPTLERSPLWSQLPFVKAKRVSVLPPVLMFGAVPSALRFARLLTEHLEDLSA